MSRSGFSTPELMKMPAQELYDQDDDTLVKIAQQLTSVVNKRINRMHDMFGEGTYKYVSKFEDKYKDRKDFRDWDRKELETYTKAAKNFLKAETTITDYAEYVERNFDTVVSTLNITDPDFNDKSIGEKAVYVRRLFDILDELREEYPAEFNQYGSDQVLNLISESFQYYGSTTINIEDMPLLIEAMKQHKSIKQLKQEEYEKENVNDAPDTSDNKYDIGGFWGVK